MKRNLIGLLCVLLLSCLLLPWAGAEEEDAPAETAQITRYEAKATVDEHGQAVMTVTVDMTIPSPLTNLDFPIGSGEDGAVAGRDTKRIKTGEGAVLRLTDEAGVSGAQTFAISYTLPRVISDTGEGQQLSLELVAPGWAWPMAEASFSVTMPAAFAEAPVYTGGYYGDIVEDYLELQCDGQTLSGTFTEPLRDHDSLEVVLSLPADYADLRSANGISSLATLILVALLAAACVFYWYKTLYNRRVAVRLRPIPPDGAGAGDLPLLTTCQAPSLPLQIMQWASMGYAAVHVNRKGRIVLRQTMPMGAERRKQERGVFAAIFEKDGWCDGESLRFGRLSGRYAAALTAWWNRRLFSRTSGSPALLHLTAALASGAAALGCGSAGLPVGRLRGVFLALAAVLGIALGLVFQKSCLAAARRQYRKALVLGISLAALLLLAVLWGGQLPMLLAVLLQIFAALATLRGGRRSPGGRDSLAQTLGFRRYLQHVSQHQLVLLLRDDSQYFYKLLPYAEAMGLGADFAARFGELALEPCAWLETPQRPPVTAAEFYQSFRAVLSRMEAAEK